MTAVKNQAQLAAALKAAKGGETITLAAGEYELIKLNSRRFPAPVTITSSAGARVARVDLHDCANITLISLRLGRQTRPEEVDWTQLHNVNKCADITFDRVSVSGGDHSPEKSIGWGLFVRGCQRVAITNSTFDHCALALNLADIDGLTVRGNSFRDNRRDAMNLSQIRNAVIEGNEISEMYPVGGEHPDAIQFLTNGTTIQSRGITIRNNVIMQGHGAPIQGIFMNDEVGRLPYEDLLIENNLVYVTGMWNGICVTGGRNVRILGNTTLSGTLDNKKAWIRIERVHGATIDGNVADILVNGPTNSGVTLGTNLWLNLDKGAPARFRDIDKGPKATVRGLTVPEIGYRAPARPPTAGLSKISGR